MKIQLSVPAGSRPFGKQIGSILKPRVGKHPLKPEESSKGKAEEELTYIEGKSTKFCPYCHGIRKRKYGRSAPLTLHDVEHLRSHCDQRAFGKAFPITGSRIAKKRAWWNRGIILWLVTPDTDSPYYFCWETAQCDNPICIQKGHSFIYIEEKCCYRQFILIRRFLFVVGGWVSEMAEHIKHGFHSRKNQH